MSKFFNKYSQAVLDELDENALAIFANADGARLFAKIRGASATEVGFMLGAAQASLTRQIMEFRKHIMNTRGGDGVSDYDRGLNAGREKTAYHEGLGIREFPKPENDNG